MISQNSVQAFSKLEITGITAKQKQDILFALLTQSPQTRNQLEKTAQMRLSAVCGRVNDLMEHGYIEVQERVTGEFGTPVDALKLSDTTRRTILKAKEWHEIKAQEVIAGFGDNPSDTDVLTYLQHLKASM